MRDEITIVHTTTGRCAVYVNGRIAYNDVEVSTLVVTSAAYKPGEFHLPADLGEIPQEARVNHE